MCLAGLPRIAALELQIYRIRMLLIGSDPIWCMLSALPRSDDLLLVVVEEEEEEEEAQSAIEAGL